MDTLSAESDLIESDLIAEDYDLMCRAARRAFDELEALRASFDTTGVQILRAARKHKRLLRQRDALCRLLDDDLAVE